MGDTGKTVYFLGAGASCASDFGLPTMKGFFRKDDFCLRKQPVKYPNLFEFIKRKFGEIHFSELNLEEVITFLALSLDSVGSFGDHPEVYIYQALREFDEYVSYRLNITEPKGCSEHKKIIDASLAGSNSKDSIITLNYDLIVDNTLYELSPKESSGNVKHECLLERMYHLLGRIQLWHGERASLRQEDKDLGFYLKLHGSVDWIYCENPNCGNHQLFFPNWLGSDSAHNKPGDLCSLCGSPLVAVIVPPTMHKTFEKFPKLGLIWSLAYRELRKADRIVIFGVSFAPSDYYLRWLFTKAVRGRENKPVIYNINNDESVCAKVETITGIRPEYKASLNDFLAQK